MLMTFVRPWGRRSFLLAAVLGSAVGGMTSSPGAAAPDDTAFHATSMVAGLKFTLRDTLPEAPRVVGREICNCVADPKSAGGKLVKARGWPVTSEAAMGRFEAVSFAADFENFYGGSYVTEQGNVGIFDGSRLVALIYGAKASDQAIGSLEALEGGGVRVWDGGGSSSAPVGDIRAEGNDLRLGPVAAEQSFCSGKAVVPNIYAMPINKARVILQEKGWKPVPAKLEANQERELALAKLGIVEADGCSGVGLAYCSFVYTSAAGTLGVTTIGDDKFPTVSGYHVKCR